MPKMLMVGGRHHGQTPWLHGVDKLLMRIPASDDYEVYLLQRVRIRGVVAEVYVLEALCTEHDGPGGFPNHEIVLDAAMKAAGLKSTGDTSGMG